MLVEKACALAAEMVKQAGFVHLYSSQVSIATYYAWPGQEKRAALRIADHKYGGPRREDFFTPTVATITFNEKNYKMDAAGVSQIPKVHIVNQVARGIGMYFLRISGVLMAPSKCSPSHGKRIAEFRSEIPGLDDVIASRLGNITFDGPR